MSDALRSEIRDFLRLDIERTASALNFESEHREPEFTRNAISYRGSDQETIRAFWFEPATPKPGAVVVALHQHNSEWALGKSEIAGLAGDPLQSFGPALARAGVAVLVPDALGFESRRGSGASGVGAPPNLRRPSVQEDWLQYYKHAMHRLARGELVMTKLQRMGIGLVGHSFGGNVALFAAAMDTRIAFTCASGAACSYRYKLAHGIGLEMALVIPGISSRFDLDDLMRCTSPRKLFVVSSDADPLAADAGELVANARPAFGAAGVDDNLRHMHVAGGHALDEARHSAIIDWLRMSAVSERS